MDPINNKPMGTTRSRVGRFKRLTKGELQEKIKKGLCFRCDEKFGPDHVCKNKQYKVMLMEEQASEGEDETTRERVFMVQEEDHKAL